jgi:hypothetical protein
MAETFVLAAWSQLVVPLSTARTWIVSLAGRSNLRDDGLVTIGFKTGSRGDESEAIYTMLEVSASKFESECEQ